MRNLLNIVQIERAAKAREQSRATEKLTEARLESDWMDGVFPKEALYNAQIAGDTRTTIEEVERWYKRRDAIYEQWKHAQAEHKRRRGR
jgi:hypothetical protein